MSGKAKPQKHTAKEIAMKAHEAKMKKGGRGGGEDGLEKRKAPKEGKRNIFIKCTICFTMQPSVKSMEFTMRANTLKKTGKLSKLTMKQSSIHRLSHQLLKNK